jgi:hypothetical protein
VTYTDVLTIASNGYNGPSWQVPLYGAGLDTVRVEVVAPDGGEEWRYGTAQKIEWESAEVGAVDLEYRGRAGAPWVGIADSVADAGKSYVWVIPDAPAESCVVRVLRHGGGAEDESKATFRITVPYLRLFCPSPNFHCGDGTTLDIGLTVVGEVGGAAIRVMNEGTAPLTIHSVTSDDPQFQPGRSSLVVGVGANDTVAVYYQPAAAGFDTAHVTLLADDPGSPHVVEVRGRGVTTLAVEEAAPRDYALWPPRPNPFASRTVIRYALPARVRVSLAVYDLKGERVATLVEGEQGPGEQSVEFGPGAGGRRAPLAAGIYFCRLRAGSYSSTRRMVLMR